MSNGRALIPYDRREAITLTIAATIADVTPETVRLWCLNFHIGRKVGARWRVSRPALMMHLEDDRAALRAYLAGDRAGDKVRPYFERAGLVAPKQPASA